MFSVEAIKKACSEQTIEERAIWFSRFPDREGLFRTLLLASPMIRMNFEALGEDLPPTMAVIVDVPAPGLYRDNPQRKPRRDKVFH